MPIYCYTNHDESEYVEVVQKMNDVHEYFGEDGEKWTRVFTVPQAAICTKIDYWNPKDFVEKTAAKKGTVGDLWDQAREASDKRAKEAGKDPIKEKYYDDYAKKRGGKTQHVDRKIQKAKESLEKKGIIVQQ